MSGWSGPSTTLTTGTKERQTARPREGIAVAEQRGVYTGRKPALTAEQAQQLRGRVAAGDKKSALAREVGISRETVCSYLRPAAVTG